MAFIPLLALVAGLAGAGSDKAPIHIVGIGQGDTIACEGRAVVVEGTDHDLTFTGDCAGLTLTGTGSKVAIDLRPGAAVAVTGTDQTVKWRSAKAPTVRVTGIDNHVSKAP